MCGLVGLLIRNESMRPHLGEFMLPMFECMAERGPDSAGVAVFQQPIAASLRRYNLFAFDKSLDWKSLAAVFEKDTKVKPTVQIIDNHAIWTAAIEADQMAKWLAPRSAEILLLSVGRAIDVYKDMGNPTEIVRRYRFSELSGTHGVGHTRMATESMISPAHAHPYTAGEDFCLVHNGSLSNPYMLRRMLESKGLHFQTDNDTEAACRYIEWRLQEGDTLEQAVTHGFSMMDGFYTLLIATSKQMLLVRDAFACKPAVVAETDDWVAVASEFRSLAKLPGVSKARIYEPRPEEICSWKV